MNKKALFNRSYIYTIEVQICGYGVSTNFRLELIEPSAREVEGLTVFFSTDAVSFESR